MIITPPRITPRHRPDLAKFVISSIESRGVDVPRASRLCRMRDLYNSGKGTIGPEHPDFEIALEGERDLQLLAFAFDQLDGVEPAGEFPGLLRRLVQDSVLPQDDRENSPGRDAAFEIYIGAICHAAQFDPVAWEEPPDVTFTVDDVRYGLAAKRIKSLKNLTKRVKDAVRQVDRSGLPGFVVLDVGLAFNPDNLRLCRMSETVFLSEYESNFRVTWSRYQPRVQELISRADILGVIVHDYHVCQQPEGWQLTGQTIRVAAENRSAADQDAFKRLSTLYTYALPNQTDADSRPLILP